MKPAIAAGYTHFWIFLGWIFRNFT